MPLERLDGLYQNWRNEIPDRIIHGDSPPPINYKVRRNWFDQMIGVLEQSLLLGEVPAGMTGEVVNFLTHYTSQDFRDQELTTPTDIQVANGLIERLRGF